MTISYNDSFCQIKMSFKKRIFFRIFPTEKITFDYVKLDSNKIYVRHLQELSKSGKKGPNYWEFETNGIFFNATQETVCNKVEEGVLENVLNGYNAVILSFGQTGSGKTFTTSGLHVTEQEFGLLPRMAKELLELKNKEPKNIKICIQMSYIEVYNTYAVDLLRNDPNVIDIYKCRDVRKVSILSELDALKSIFIGEGRKKFVSQNCKYLSNLSTSVATFHVTKRNMDLSNPTKVYTRLHIIDLAGNDSCGNITNMYKNPKQISLANVTKSQLEQFILCLSENIPTNIKVKQRMNVLTYYLDGDFSHESILRFVGHIKVKTEDLMITLSMLRFGNIVQGLKMKKKVIPFDINEEVELKYLRSKLQSIEKEKHLNSVLLNQNLVSGMNTSRLTHLNNLIEEYLKDDISEITVMNVADTKAVLESIKEICHDYQNDIKKLQTENELLMAQQQSDTSLKQRNSKTSSNSSGSKISRKSSKVMSKDSITKEKRTSSTSDKRVQKSATETSVILAKRKKSVKSSVTAFNKQSSSPSKRKSSNTSIIDKRESKCSIKSSKEFQMAIPNMIPDKQDLWKRFISQSNYKERMEEYKQNEKDVRTSFIYYVREIKKLQYCREAVDKWSNDLLQAQTFSKFHHKDQFDDGEILPYIQNECKEQLEECQETLVTQQEKVLTSQEILKAHLENRRSILKRVEEEFDQYSADNYRLPVADLDMVKCDLDPYNFEVNLESTEDVFEHQEEITSLPKVSDNVQILRNLQKLMARERRKRNQILNKKGNEWKNV